MITSWSRPWPASNQRPIMGAPGSMAIVQPAPPIRSSLSSRAARRPRRAARRVDLTWHGQRRPLPAPATESWAHQTVRRQLQVILAHLVVGARGWRHTLIAAPPVSTSPTHPRHVIRPESITARGRDEPSAGLWYKTWGQGGSVWCRVVAEGTGNQSPCVRVVWGPVRGCVGVTWPPTTGPHCPPPAHHTPPLSTRPDDGRHVLTRLAASPDPRALIGQRGRRQGHRGRGHAGQGRAGSTGQRGDKGSAPSEPARIPPVGVHYNSPLVFTIHAISTGLLTTRSIWEMK